MELPLYQIDAFAEKPFTGNPAAVCPLDEWLPEEVMQAIAQENNLSETAFFVPNEKGFQIRWFTPVAEIDLCGHATLAAAHVLFEFLGYRKDEIAFESRSGMLTVGRKDGLLVMDFPAQPPTACDTPEAILRAFGAAPVECLKSEDYLVVLKSEADVRAADPDLAMLKTLDLRGVMITAGSTDFDFAVRFFGPKYGIAEDPVTGSAYTQLVPYWAHRTGATRFRAGQLSKRRGEVFCELAGDRVKIAGSAVTYLVGRIVI